MILVTGRFIGSDITRTVGIFTEEDKALEYLRKKGVKPNRSNECDYWVMEGYMPDWPSGPITEVFATRKLEPFLPKYNTIIL